MDFYESYAISNESSSKLWVSRNDLIIWIYSQMDKGHNEPILRLLLKEMEYENKNKKTTRKS